VDRPSSRADRRSERANRPSSRAGRRCEREDRSSGRAFGRSECAARDPEVEHLHDAVVAHHHVLGLHVAVHEAEVVRGAERARDVDEPAEPPRHRDRPVADQRPQRAPLDELHREERHAVHVADVVDRDRVRVREARRGAGLAEDARRRLRAPRLLVERRVRAEREEELQRDVAVEHRVVRAMHLPQAPLPSKAESSYRPK
jgi:hypothetical protein